MEGLQYHGQDGPQIINDLLDWALDSTTLATEAGSGCTTFRRPENVIGPIFDWQRCASIAVRYGQGTFTGQSFHGHVTDYGPGRGSADKGNFIHEGRYFYFSHSFFGL